MALEQYFEAEATFLAGGLTFTDTIALFDAANKALLHLERTARGPAEREAGVLRLCRSMLRAAGASARKARPEWLRSTTARNRALDDIPLMVMVLLEQELAPLQHLRGAVLGLYIRASEARQAAAADICNDPRLPTQGEMYIDEKRLHTKLLAELCAACPGYKTPHTIARRSQSGAAVV